MPTKEILADVPVMLSTIGSEPMPGELMCAGCPAAGLQQELFSVDLDGPGPDNLAVGPKTLAICCRVEEVRGHYTDMNEKLIFKRGAET